MIGQDKSGKSFDSTRQLTCLRLENCRGFFLNDERSGYYTLTTTFCDAMSVAPILLLNYTCNPFLPKTQLTNNKIYKRIRFGKELSAKIMDKYYCFRVSALYYI